eukprot:78944_1
MSKLLLVIITAFIHNVKGGEDCIGDCECFSVSNSTGYRCTLRCSGDSACRDSTLTCRTGDQCFIECTGAHSCEGATIIGSNATDLTVDCTSEHSCKNNVIDCGTGDCQLQCEGTGNDMCTSLVVNNNANATSFQCTGSYCYQIGSAPQPYSPSPTISPISTSTSTNQPTPAPTDLAVAPLPSNIPTVTPTPTPIQQTCCQCTSEKTYPTPGCKVDLICQNYVCNNDGYCCSTSWDDVCADIASTICNSGTLIPTTAQLQPTTSLPTYSPSHLPTLSPTLASVQQTCCQCTVEKTFPTPGCNVDPICQDNVCNNDGYCCSTSWDITCANIASDICNSGTLIPTTTTHPTTPLPTHSPTPSPTPTPSPSPINTPVLIFYDGFDDNSHFNYPSYTTFGTENCVSGSCAKMLVSNPKNWLETKVGVINTMGYTNIQVTFSFLFSGWGLGNFKIYYESDVSNNVLDELLATFDHDDVTQNQQNIVTFDLPLSAGNNDKMGIYFSAYTTNNGSPYVYIDNIKIFGIQIPTPLPTLPPTTGSCTTQQINDCCCLDGTPNAYMLNICESNGCQYINNLCSIAAPAYYNCIATCSTATSPTNIPTKSPTNEPFSMPTNKPTETPTNTQTVAPTNKPTTIPSRFPTHKPSSIPSNESTNKPTDTPTVDPTNEPTTIPSGSPTYKPSLMPTNSPTTEPTDNPTKY